MAVQRAPSVPTYFTLSQDSVGVGLDNCIDRGIPISVAVLLQTPNVEIRQKDEAEIRCYTGGIRCRNWPESPQLMDAACGPP
jgi:hypothetical protein